MKKKIIYFGLFLLLILIITLVSIIPRHKDNKKLKNITIGEVAHSVFYAPMYAAIENNYFEEEGININLVLTSGADKVSAAVLSGDVEIGFAGAESAIYVYKNGEKDYLQIFAGLTKKDGQFILSRNKENNFSLNDLKGKEIIVGRQSGMPALNFLNALKNAGITTKDININYSVEFAALSGAFIGGTGDYVNLFEPTATSIEKNGFGHVVASIGNLSGEMPYTTFYARKSFVENNSDVIKSFRNAINKGLKFVRENDNEKVAKTILKQFPDTSLNDLTKIINRYKENDAWLKDTYISEDLLKNLENLLMDNNLLDNYVDYNKLIKND